MKYPVFLLLISITFSVLGQELITDDNVVLKRGVYRSFEEFKFNSPSLTLDFKVIENIEKFGKDNFEHISYLLNVDSFDNVGYVYGFCDGEKIYVRENIGIEDYTFKSFKLKKKTQFEVLDFVGLYSCYNNVGMGSGGLGLVHSTIKAIAVKELYCFAININNGNVIGIGRGSVKREIYNDAVILQEYKDAIWEDTLTVLSMKNFLIKYSNIHKVDGIVKRRRSMSREAAEVFLKKKEAEINIMDYYNRVKGEFEMMPSFISIDLVEKIYMNGKTRSKGLIAKHIYSRNDPYPVKIGYWVYYNKSGKLVREEEYNLRSVKLDD